MNGNHCAVPNQKLALLSMRDLHRHCHTASSGPKWPQVDQKEASSGDVITQLKRLIVVSPGKTTDHLQPIFSSVHHLYN